MKNQKKEKTGLLNRAKKINQRQQVWSILAILLGIICISYDVLLNILCPGTFMDIVLSFSHIWSVFGGYHIFVGIYRIVKNHSFFCGWKRSLKLTTGCLFLISLFICFINLYFILTPAIAEENEAVNYVILLGGGIDKNGKLPKTVELRVKKTAEYLTLHENAICVVSGGTLHFLPYAEAPALKNYLINNGIDEKRILIDDQALDTIQNFQNSCKILAEYKGVSEKEILNSRVTVITSYFHLRRAERLANRMGFTQIKGIASKTPLLHIPHSYLREICSYIKLNLRILLTGKPEPIA